MIINEMTLSFFPKTNSELKKFFFKSVGNKYLNMSGNFSKSSRESVNKIGNARNSHVNEPKIKMGANY